MRVTLIHNPKAGRHARNDAARLCRFLREFGYEVRYHSAKDKGLKRVLRKPADLVMVAGGDGTVAKVARRMVGRGVPIAVLPSGTANNVARALGLLERPFEEIVRALDGGLQNARRVKVDIGRVVGPWGERNFMEGVGAGLFARLLAEPASEKLKDGRSPVKRGLRALRDAAAEFEPIEIVAALDGRDISGRYLLMEAVNMPYIGPNLHLALESRPGDGELDVVLVTEAERERLVHYLDEWQENRERLAILPSVRGRRLELEWTGFAMHLDDKARPNPDDEPDELAGIVEVAVDSDSAVEFLIPA